MTENPVKRYELCTERLETLDDVKKILKAMQIRIDTDNPLYEELKEYFVVEVVPPGYLKVYEKVGSDELHKMTYEEIAQMGRELLSEIKSNEE